jgi:hypothetical protein
MARDCHVSEDKLEEGFRRHFVSGVVENGTRHIEAKSSLNTMS